MLTATQFFDIHSASRRNALAFYGSMLFCRAKQRRNRSQKTYATLHAQFAELVHDDEWIAETTDRFIKRHGAPITTQMVKDRLKQLATMMDCPTALRNNFVEDLVSATEIMKSVILEKPWQLWNAPKGMEFVTSDNPFISFIPMGNGRLNSGHGLRKTETIGLFPLTPHTVRGPNLSGPTRRFKRSARVTLSFLPATPGYGPSPCCDEGVIVPARLLRWRQSCPAWLPAKAGVCQQATTRNSPNPPFALRSVAQMPEL